MVMTRSIKRKADAALEDVRPVKKVATTPISPASNPDLEDTTQGATAPSFPQPVDDFPLFPLLPVEVQLQIFEAAVFPLAAHPRILNLTTTLEPTFDRLTRSVTNGWALSVPNRAQLHALNPYSVARSLLISGSPTAARVAREFLRDPHHEVWLPPRYSPQLLSLDLSLHSDVFLLPDDLRGFLNMRRALPAASCKVRRTRGVCGA